ncbi:MAG: hypothetical protein CMO19_02120 [Thaumarchaeota archaeon]|nr:hypothetical protein [Nitrososphaerota archaeon]|tara:strand:+ start:10971 stop:11255 length:285 start_codon:yes stop_codon:yes gene_type:complete
MYEGELVNLLEASLIGYELIYVDKKKKLTKIYSEEESNSYNVSISLDSINKINELQIVQIVWGKENEAEIRELEIIPEKLQKSLDLDIKKITKI